jgi:catechol 2,3-dioxygenase-like lactoylglutathione lyase family enzyme
MASNLVIIRAACASGEYLYVLECLYHRGKSLIKTVWSITFYVSDLKKAARFYEKTLGLERKYEFSSYVGFECGGVEIGLIPRPKGEAPCAMSATVQLLVDDVDQFCRGLKMRGVEFTKEPHDETWGGRQATFKDPDGNFIEPTLIDWRKYFEVSAHGAQNK